MAIPEQTGTHLCLFLLQNEAAKCACEGAAALIKAGGGGGTLGRAEIGALQREGERALGAGHHRMPKIGARQVPALVIRERVFLCKGHRGIGDLLFKEGSKAVNGLFLFVTAADDVDGIVLAAAVAGSVEIKGVVRAVLVCPCADGLDLGVDLGAVVAVMVVRAAFLALVTVDDTVIVDKGHAENATVGDGARKQLVKHAFKHVAARCLAAMGAGSEDDARFALADREARHLALTLMPDAKGVKSEAALVCEAEEAGWVIEDIVREIDLGFVLGEAVGEGVAYILIKPNFGTAKMLIKYIVSE